MMQLDPDQVPTTAGIMLGRNALLGPQMITDLRLVSILVSCKYV